MKEPEVIGYGENPFTGLSCAAVHCEWCAAVFIGTRSQMPEAFQAWMRHVSAEHKDKIETV